MDIVPTINPYGNPPIATIVVFICFICSETQLQVGEIFYKLTYRGKGNIRLTFKVGGSLCFTESKYLLYGRPHSCGC